MIFDNEEERLAYHKTNSIMQALAGAFEALCFSYGVQVRLFKIHNEWNASFIVPLHPEALTEIEGWMNSRYPRNDKYATCEVEDLDLGIVRIYGRSGNDLTTLA